MNLLLASDLHNDLDAARELVRRAKQADVCDVVIVAGDLCNAHQGLGRCVKVLRGIPQHTVLVAGNNETTEALQSECENWANAHVLHGSAVEIDGVNFFGLGGGIPITPFGPWSYDFSEEDAERLLADCPAGGVIVSHSPPHGVLDVSSRGTHLGSTALRDVILSRQPRLVVCGHIHASGGKEDWLRGTRVINAGPAGVLVELA